MKRKIITVKSKEEKELWEKAIDNPVIQEKLKLGMLFGELVSNRHIECSIEVPQIYITHRTNKIWWEELTLWGEMEILDVPGPAITVLNRMKETDYKFTPRYIELGVGNEEKEIVFITVDARFTCPEHFRFIFEDGREFELCDTEVALMLSHYYADNNTQDMLWVLYYEGIHGLAHDPNHKLLEKVKEKLIDSYSNFKGDWLMKVAPKENKEKYKEFMYSKINRIELFEKE